MVKPFLIAVAPMMDYTDRHDRYLLRLIAPKVRLYTEMITTAALIHGDQNKLLAYHPAEKYVALQLGGSNPKELAYCARLGEAAGYDEINLNVGCPSSRVKAGHFGACLMLQPALVADCVASMQHAVRVPVTVKCRIGVDDYDSYEALSHFITQIKAAGCQTVIVHARKAWLAGLSPRENREIPPLHYETVWQLKRDFPELCIIINGGLTTQAGILSHVGQVDGVMIGRAAYANPYLLAELHQHFYPQQPLLTRAQVVHAYLPYIKQQLNANIRLSAMTRHMLGLFHSQPGGARWRRYLSEEGYKPGAGLGIVEQALSYVQAD